MGAGRRARLNERHAVTAVRPHGRGNRRRPRRQFCDRGAVSAVRNDQRPIRDRAAKLLTQEFEFLSRATGDADTRLAWRRARQIPRRELADEASRAEKDDIEATHLRHANDQQAIKPTKAQLLARRRSAADITLKTDRQANPSPKDRFRAPYR